MKKIFCAFMLFLSMGVIAAVAGCGENPDVGGTNGCKHEYSEWKVVTAATCSEDGSEERVCSKCGYKDTRTSEAIGHKWGKEKEIVQQATCKEQGKKAIVCERCKATKDEETIALAEHSYGEWIIETPPTCDSEGEQKRVCSVCNHTETQKLDALMHDFDDPNPETVAVTCTTDGTITYHCQHSGCTKTKVETIEHKGHQWVDVENTRVEPTCTQDGSVHQKCSVCTDEQDFKLEKTGHTYERTIHKAATCTEDGSATDVCEKNDHTREVILHKLGHDVDRYLTIDKKPTDTEDGKVSHHCLRENCDYVEGEETLKKGAKVTYSFSVVRENGGPVPAVKLELLDSTGKVLKTVVGNTIGAELEIGEYRAKISNLSDGLSVASETITLTNRLHGDFVLKTQIYDAQEGKVYQYDLGSVVKNHKIHVVGSTEKEDYDTNIKKLLKDYKAILVNCYYTTCHFCMEEMQDMIDAYNAVSSTGKIFGNEVAMMMIPAPGMGDTISDVRAFLNEPKSYAGSVKAAKLPFIMAFQGDFFNSLQVEGCPTTFIIDSQGVFVYKYLSGMSKEQFTEVMEKGGIELYNALQPVQGKETVEEDLPAESITIPEAILPERKH